MIALLVKLVEDDSISVENIADGESGIGMFRLSGISYDTVLPDIVQYPGSVLKDLSLESINDKKRLMHRIFNDM
jgi:hypothetical protein